MAEISPSFSAPAKAYDFILVMPVSALTKVEKVLKDTARFLMILLPGMMLDFHSIFSFSAAP